MTLQKSINLISWFNEAITIANNKIKSHNDIVNNFSKEKNQLIDDVWAYIIKEDKDFKIGFFETNFNEYLTKLYNKSEHGKLIGKTYIQCLGKKLLNIKPLDCNIYKYKDLQYYEFDRFELNTIELGIENIK